ETRKATTAKVTELDKLVKIGVRQGREGPQPGVLKNAMYALVAAVWSQAQDWSRTVGAMVNLGLLCKTEFGIDPSSLNEPGSTNDLFRAVMPYQAPLVESKADKGSPHNGEGLEEGGQESWVRPDDHNSSPMELEYTVPNIMASFTLTQPSSVENQRANICGGISTNLLHETPPVGSPHTHERLHRNSRDSLDGTHAIIRTNNVEEGRTIPNERTASVADPSPCANGHY
ncbi:hypothetical protein LTR49_024553, partial [Elasticomyces elasticus]